MHHSRRAVLIGGLRTPFVPAFADYRSLSCIDLGATVVSGLIEKYALPRQLLDELFFGCVILPPNSPNVAREIAIELNLNHVPGTTCSAACTTGLEAIRLAQNAIEQGECDIAIAGGTDSISQLPLTFSPKVAQAITPLLARGKPTFLDWCSAFAQLAPFDQILPGIPRIAERITGEILGCAADAMAARNQITREEQDAYAVESHHRAAEALAAGRFDDELCPVDLPDGQKIYADKLIRADASIEKLARLRPAFVHQGTVTAGNSTALTDGAAAVLLMEEQKALELGYQPLAAFRAFAKAAVDPRDQLFAGPVHAIPKLLQRADLSLGQIDVIELHEDFAAQLLADLKLIQSDAYAKAHLQMDRALGVIDRSKLNIHGGSIAIGHPFSATGARLVTTAANELALHNQNYALVCLCGGGGLGLGAVLERL